MFHYKENNKFALKKKKYKTAPMLVEVPREKYFGKTFSIPIQFIKLQMLKRSWIWKGVAWRFYITFVCSLLHMLCCSTWFVLIAEKWFQCSDKSNSSFIRPWPWSRFASQQVNILVVKHLLCYLLRPKWREMRASTNQFWRVLSMLWRGYKV